MKTRSLVLKWLAVVACAVLVGGALVTTSAHAQTTSKTRDLCRTASPAKVLTLSSDKTSVEARRGGRYSSGRCDRFVVDVHVEHHPNDHRVVVDGSPFIAKGTTKTQCLQLNAWVTYYVKKAGQRTFSKIGGGRMVGQWSVGGPQPGCGMKGTSNYKAPGQRTYPASGKTDTYRIAISAKRDRGHFTSRYKHPVIVSARDFAIPK